MKSPQILAACLLGTMISLVYAAPSDDEVIQNYMYQEAFHIQLQLCNEKYPEYKEKNDAAASASEFYAQTGEKVIRAMTTGEQQKRLLANLPKFRAEMHEEVKNSKTRPEIMKAICADFPEKLQGMEENYQKYKHNMKV